MNSFLSQFSPIPSFPAYTGPYKVGTQDIQIPISELASPSPVPDHTISTISFRIFYPCLTAEKVQNHVYWLPSPQNEHFRAYARFLSASPRLATFLSYLPFFRTIYHTTMPALKDAKIAIPPESVGRWPVMVFSHGLGGSRNAYSHITGSLASHGMVVIAPEHRDGSCPISYIRNADGSPPKTVPYRSLPHKSSEEVDEGRDEQLRIRLAELSLTHDALFKLDNGAKFINIATDKQHTHVEVSQFANLLDVHTPGKISWAGHSFGAATVIQFIKSIYYPPAPSSKPLYKPSSSTLQKQITASTPIALLDLWTQPLLSPFTSWLWQHPLPAYTSSSGSAPLAILSEAFFKWSANLRDTKRAVAPPSDSKSGVEPQIFYPLHSAHLSQSDFGLLYRWATKKVFKAEEPERTMRLNVRAILEHLRRSGIQVADTSKTDMEIDPVDYYLDITDEKGVEERQKYPLRQDHKILATDGSVRGWVAVPLDSSKDNGDANGHAIQAGHPAEAVMKGEVMKGEL